MLSEPYAPSQLSGKPKKKLKAIEIVFVLFIVGLLSSALIPAVFDARDRKMEERRISDYGRLRNIGIAIMEYEQDYHCLPPAYTVDANGNKLHSWRTLILPYLDLTNLYNQIDLSKPWNAPENTQIASTLNSESFFLASSQLPPGQTCFRAILHPRGIFSGDQSTTYNSIHDDLVETILIVQAGKNQSTPWMKPEDYTLSDFLQAHNDTTLYPDGYTYIFASNGSLRTIHVQQAGAKVIESMVIIDDGSPKMQQP